MIIDREVLIHELFSEFGHKGGSTTFKRHGREHYRSAQKLSVEARLRNKALRHEAEAKEVKT
jgi:hypothetical protein